MKFKKRHFIQTMEYIVESIRKYEKFNKAIQEYTNDTNFSGFFMNDDFLLDLLKELYDDKSDWIGYWLYDLDCGKLAKKKSIQMKGKNIPIKTLDDLYNIII